MVLNQKSNLKNQTQRLKVKNNFRERCYKYSIDIIRFTATIPETRVYSILSDQVLRSATSIGANIVEAKSANSKREYIRYFEIALKSANETKYWFGLLRDALDVDGTTINKLLNETGEIANIIAASLLTMKGKQQI